MRVHQIISTISYGDAVSNDAIAMRDVLVSMGYYTRIYAEHIWKGINAESALPLSKLPNLNSDDVVIYHLSTGTKLTRRFAGLPCRKVVVYHNSTPPEFFFRNNSMLMHVQKQAQRQITALAPYVDYCIADSQYNKQDLREKGYTCPIDVLPILIPFEDYDRPSNPRLLARYSDSAVNLLHTGRISPNKKIEDVISAFYCYQKHYCPNSRLFLIGSFSPSDRYCRQIAAYISRLGLEESVVIPGHSKFQDILTYYRLADAYLCMSEHEGFCVPLVEAMYFNLPVVAYASTAIPETLGGSGLLLQEKDPMQTAAAVDWLMRNPVKKKIIVENQRERLRDFSYERINERFSELFTRFLEENA